jgi:Arylsulfatase regulator (Fe-S oxidoreductase)
VTPPCLIVYAPLSGNLGESDCACENFSTAISAIEPSESDCACAPAAAPIQAGLPAGGLWGLAPALYRAPLPGGYQVAFSPTGPAGVVVLNGPAARALDAFAAPAPLADPTARQLAALGLLTPAHATENATRNTPHAFTFHAFTFHALTFHVFTVWLHLTTRCNLRCAYCYAPRGQADMPPEVGRAAVDGAIRSARAHGFRALKLKYAGGEPTLNLPTLRAVHRYARVRAPEAGLDLREVLLTNGTTLTPGLLQWLRDEGIRLAISLDGLGPAHDGQRASENGAGSFARIAEGIERAQASGLTPHLSVTVTAHNVDGLAEVVAFALDRGLPFNLNFVRPAPGRPDLTPDPERFISGLQGAL